MNKVVVSSVIMAILLLTAMNTLAQEQAQAPVYTEGDFWQFRLGKRLIEATVKDGQLKFFDPKPDRRLEISDERFPTLKNMLSINEGENPFLQFPLFVGKQWDVSEGATRSGSAKHDSRSEITRNVHNQVTSFEDTTTSAGTFKAFKIEATATPGKRRLFFRTIFYSPETRSIVKYRLESAKGNTAEIELLKFGRKN